MNKTVWEYNISEEDFRSILRGDKSIGWCDQEWALLRCINNLNYYELIKTVPLGLIKTKWEKIKDRIRLEDVRYGLEFVLRRETLP